MEFWVVPNQAGLPTVSAEQAVAAGGVNPNSGKSCTVRRIGFPVQTIPDDTLTPLEFDEIIHDDLGFFNPSFPERLTIPDVDPPIRAVRCWGNINWGLFPNATDQEYLLFVDAVSVGFKFLATESFFEHFVMTAGGNVPVAWTGVSASMANYSLDGASPLQAGDIFTFEVRHNEGAGVDVARSGFAIEVVR